MNLTSLIKACLSQDRVSQRVLYDRYKDSLYTVAIRLTDDKMLAADILQETFIEAFRQLANLRQPEYFHSWVKKILVRKAYRHLDNNKKNVELNEVTFPSTMEMSDVSYIEKAIQSLPYKSRTVFVMAEIEGFSHKEIAEELGVTVGTSKSQLNYAKTKLKAMLASYR